MNQQLESNFNEFEKPLIIRRKLLLWWIKFFCWIFMIMGVCGISSLIGNIFIENIDLSIYGFSSNTSYSGTGIFIIAIMIFKGVSAYSL